MQKKIKRNLEKAAILQNCRSEPNSLWNEVKNNNSIVMFLTKEINSKIIENSIEICKQKES